jgi:NTE family protein
MRLNQYLIVGLMMCIVQTFAQSQGVPPPIAKRPKIGLVLSGGGAKGFAHIGAIRLLEEVGIIPDYITGTSMGSIVGALYAMGYTVEEMEHISDTTDWGIVLSNNVLLSEVTVAEKPYYGTFLTELDISKSGVSLPGGLIEGQNLLEKLSVLSRPVHGIHSFLDFPIPFTCIATDIVNGVPVALNQGSVADAIRASMAIPTAFTPVEIDTLLLIDGGWTRNLPVQEAREMGADIIISINVGASLKEKEELQSMISILDQTAWLLSAQDTKRQIENSDFVVTPDIKSFSTFDFDKSDTIIKKGYEAALKQRAVFEKLAKDVYGNGDWPQKAEKPFFDSLYTISSIVVSGNILTSDKFVGGRLNIDKDNQYSAEEISEKVGLLYGTLYFKKVGFELVPLKNGTQELRIHVVEDNPAKVKLSMYYDTENSVGINLNLTFRNLLSKNSRLIFDGFLSENPIFGLKYVKYIGQNQNSFLFGDIKYTKDSRYIWRNLNLDEAGFNYRDFIANAGIAFTIDNQWMFGASVGIQAAKLSPTTNQDTIVDSWTQNAFPLGMFLSLNTLDRAVYPTRGIRFLTDVAYNFNVKHVVNLKPGFTSLTSEQVNDLVYVDPHFMFKVGYQQYIPVHHKLSLFVDGRMALPSLNKVGFNDYSKVGGIAPILNSAVPFWGLDRNEITVRQYASVSVGFQWNMWQEFYLKGKVNYMNSEYPMVWFDDDILKDPFTLYGNERTSILGWGTELSYNSAFGPLRLVLNQNQYNSDINVFVAFGYNIYRSEGDF